MKTPRNGKFNVSLLMMRECILLPKNQITRTIVDGQLGRGKSYRQLNTSQLLLGVGQVPFAVVDHPQVLLLARAIDGLHGLVGREEGLVLRVL